MQEKNQIILSVGERLDLAMKHNGDSGYTLSEKTGISEQNISNWRSGKSNPRSKNLDPILKYYSNINPEWLIYGRGDMIRKLDYGENDGETPQVNDMKATYNQTDMIKYLIEKITELDLRVKKLERKENKS